MCDRAKKLRDIAAQLTDAASITVLHDVADHLDWADDGLVDPPDRMTA